MAEGQLSRYTRKDLILVGAAAIAFFSLFAPWFQASLAGYTIQSVSGWGTGYGVLGALCCVLAGVYLVLERSDVNLPNLRLRASVVVLILAGLGTLILFIRLGTIPSGSEGGSGLIPISFKYGAAFGIVLALLAGVAETVCAVLLVRGGAQPAAPEAPTSQEV